MGYYLGLDIGDNSIGLAASDELYNLISRGRRHLCSVRTFVVANTARKRATYRCTERRVERRHFRIDVLQELFSEEISKFDNEFFLRLNASNLFETDKNVAGCFSLFNDSNYTDKNYYGDFPTIYHLIDYLKNTNKKEDPRLLYLACHHLIKYRGNFLFEGQSFNDTSSDALFQENIMKAFSLLVEANEFEDYNPYTIIEMEDKLPEVSRIFTEVMGKKAKSEELNSLLNPNKQSELKAVIELISGRKVKLSSIFVYRDFDESCESIQFDDSGYEEKISEYADELGDDFAVIELLKAIYDWGILKHLLHGERSLSSAMIKVYKKHNDDLKILKDFVRKFYVTNYSKKEKYKNIYFDLFRNPNHLRNYCHYVKKDICNGKKLHIYESCDKASFYSELKNLLKTDKEEVLESEEYKYIMSEIEKEFFLPKMNVTNNSVLPYQLNENELKAILENTAKFSNFLSITDSYGSLQEKIISLLTFRVPYYIGPLNDYHNYRDNPKGHAWIIRKEKGRVLPWNFLEKVDDEKTGQEFILRMTNKCTYLRGKDVLPKNSLLYSEFMLLNELNCLQINGKRLSFDLKNKIMNGLFKRVKKVTQAKFISFLITEGIIAPDEEVIISGIDGDFKCSLSSYIDFCKIFGSINDTNRDMIEEIIFLLTIFEKSTKAIKIANDKYNFGIEIEKKLKGLSYKGWGKLSKEFLSSDVFFEDSAGITHSIISVMREKSQNLNEVLYDKKFNFAKIINDINSDNFEEDSDIFYGDVDALYVSPSVKRAIWQAIKMVKETVKILGEKPKRIFVETTRSNKAKKNKTQSRREYIEKKYKGKGFNKDDINELRQELKGVSDSMLRSDKIFLYFMQLGKCAYSGKRIDLASLNTTLCDIDHIIPRSLLKDDSLDNRVLVKKTINGQKDDVYPLSPDIQAKMSDFWTFLYNNKMMSAEKFTKLQRKDELTLEELSGFINRQLVTTSQATKAVIKLLERMFAGEETKIIYAKAENVTEFRQIFELNKCRDINDFHHARDAYLNIVVGNVFYEKYGRDSYSILNALKADRISTNTKKIYDRDILNAWEKEKTIITVKNQIKKNTILVSRMPYCNHGEFYEQNLESLSKGELFPIKEKGILSDVEKYGGYNSLRVSYFMIVESDDKKGKRKVTFEGVPIIYAERMEESKDFFDFVLTKHLRLINPKVLVRRLKIDSLLQIDDSYVYIRGKSLNQILICNASQFFDNDKIVQVYRKAQKYNNMLVDGVMTSTNDPEVVLHVNKKSGEVKILNKDELIFLYDYILDKLSKKPYCSLSSFKYLHDNLVSAHEKFNSCTLKDQCDVIIQLMKVMKCDSQSANLECIGLAKNACKLVISKVITDRKVVIFNQSVTGFYKNISWEMNNVL